MVLQIEGGVPHQVLDEMGEEELATTWESFARYAKAVREQAEKAKG